MQRDIERGEAKLNNPGFTGKAPAQLVEQEREKLRQRAARAADFTAMREIVSDFVGWQEGHGPYQL